MRVSYLPLEGEKKSLVNKGELRKAPFLRQQPRLPIWGVPSIPGLTLKSGRPWPLGWSRPLWEGSAAFTASEYPNLFHIPGGSPKGKVIILTQTVTPCFLSHSHPLAIESKGGMESSPPWCCVALWSLLNRGHCCGSKPGTRWPAQKKAGCCGIAFSQFKRRI